METHFFIFGLSPDTMKAICWTLFHSLWIGLIVATLAGVLIAVTKKRSSHLRFNLLCGLLLLFIGLTTYTFFRQLDIAYGEQTMATGFDAAASIGIIPVQPAATATGITSYARFANALNAASGWIVAVWMVCFVFKSIQLSRQLLYIRRVRYKGATEIEGEWGDRMAVFARQLGIRRVVKVFESRLVKVPVTIGHLRPVILLPVGMILQLPAAQVESILYHELAHILRRDYLINILQSIVETVFFFNPAIWWLCALIREERETCCDDIVLANIPQKRSYLEALMSFQGYESQAGKLAMGLSLRPPQLMSRLRRMVNQENQRLNKGEKIVLLLGLLLFSLFLFVPKVNSEVRHSAVFIKKQLQAMVTSHIEQEPASLKAALPSGKTARSKTTTVARVNTAIAQEDTLFRIKSILFKDTNEDTLNVEMQVIDDRDNKYQLKVVGGQLRALSINDSTIAERDLPQYFGLYRRIQQAWAARRQQKAARGVAAKKKREEERASQLAQLDSAIRQNPMKKHRLTGADTSAPRLVKGKKKPELVVVRDSFAETHAVAKKKRHKPADISGDRQRVRGVLAALVNENVVPDESKVDWFGLSDAEFIVNGIKQPETLHEKLKTLYGIKPSFGLYYGHGNMRGGGVWMEKRDL